QLDRSAEDRIRKFAGRGERLELVSEVAAEQVVDDGQNLRTGAVVQGQRPQVGRLVASLAEDLHVGMPEPVDRLELVSDEEDLLLARAAGEEVDQLALQAVRVLELVDHDRAEAELLACADRLVVAQKIASAELEIL